MAYCTDNRFVAVRQNEERRFYLVIYSIAHIPTRTACDLPVTFGPTDHRGGKKDDDETGLVPNIMEQIAARCWPHTSLSLECKAVTFSESKQTRHTFAHAHKKQ